jgi:hypothetical protein
VLTATGLALLVLAVRDIVHELFHPEVSGSISRLVMRAVWRVVRAAGRRYRGALYQAGPLMLIAVGLTWTLMLMTGAALVYLPRLPDGFSAGPALPPSALRGFPTAMYVSGAMLTSVGVSDVMPVSPVVRLFGVLEPMLGLVLISAWITWVLSIYPVIADRRALERQVSLLRRAQPRPDALAADTPRDGVAEVLRSLAEQIIKASAQLAQLRVTYYFQNQSEELRLAAQLPYVLALARAAERHATEPLIRHHGTALRLAIENLLADIGRQYLHLHDAPAEAVLDALARDHLLS